MEIQFDALAEAFVQHREVHPGELRNLIETGRLHSTSQVLEVGCGTGNYLVAVESATRCSCWGIEPAEQMLAKARERTATAHFTVGRAEQLDYPDDFFDLVFSVDVIHHIDDRSAYLREAHRVLKKGGTVCTITDSEEIIRRRQPLSVYFPETIDVELNRYPSIAALRTTMVDVDFHNVHEAEVEFSHLLVDIGPYRDKAFSCLHLVPNDAFTRGLQRMEQDLRAGPIPSVSRYLLLWGEK